MTKSVEEEIVLVDQSISAAGRPLSTSNTTTSNTTTTTATTSISGCSIVLFYQYKEPVWTDAEFQKALKLFLKIGRKHSMTGRGRIAPEGVNCTLTGPSAEKTRGFCQALRDEWGVVEDNATANAGGGSTNIKNNKNTIKDTIKNTIKNTNKNNKYYTDADLFRQTDFKITDGLPHAQVFKSLSVRKVDELVAYGLEGEKAPSIDKFGGDHLTAVDYHDALRDPNTVVIDVRNAYETAIGTIRPPTNGATLLDPKLRNSREWPKWLASKETQQKLHGKTVLTFCTGGIRCERATALINQMAAARGEENEKRSTPATTTHTGNTSSTTNTTATASTAFQPNGVYHMRGGIERYLKTYPEGGFWSGKNYLFDKRMEQLPELKDKQTVEHEVTNTLRARCCLCRKPWTSYRKQHKCGGIECGVPVLVCDGCHNKQTATATASNNNNNIRVRLRCELCREGYRAPQGNPDLVAMRKRAEKLATVHKSSDPTLLLATTNNNNNNNADNSKLPTPKIINQHPPRKAITDRLFLNRLPLNTTRSSIEEWLQTSVRQLHWVTDVDTNAYYGSCIVRIDVFSKLLLAIKKQQRTNQTKDAALLLLSNKTDQNHGAVRELLGSFPGTATATAATTNTNTSTNTNTNANTNTKKRKRRKQRRQQQQPKIFRVLAKPDEVWPPANHCDTEYPPLGGHLQ